MVMVEGIMVIMVMGILIMVIKSIVIIIMIIMLRVTMVNMMKVIIMLAFNMIMLGRCSGLLLYLWPKEPERLIVVLPEQALLPPGAPEQGEDRGP